MRVSRAVLSGRYRTAGVVIAAVLLTACGSTDASTGNSGGTDAGGTTEAPSEPGGVSPGATIEEYQAALADMDQVELITQTPAPEGSPVGQRNESYMAAVEEWSGGKITFDVSYSNAIVPPAEIDDAIADGRLDMGLMLPVYEPSEYPANNALTQTSFQGTQTPLVGMLESHAWMLEVGYATDELHEEYESKGVHLLVPAFNSGANLVICSDLRTTVEELSGTQIAAGGSTQAEQLTRLGASPVSLDFTEIYESLQRGVVDCTGSTLLGASLGGYIPVAPHVTADPEAGWAMTTGNVGINAGVWESLPLAAQQLLFDRIDTFIEGSIEGDWTSIADAVDQIEAEGGQISPMSDDARARLLEINEQLLDEARENPAISDSSAFVDRLVEAASTWEQIVTEDLGYEDEVDYVEFVERLRVEDIDLEPYLDRLRTDVLNPNRPS